MELVLGIWWGEGGGWECFSSSSSFWGHHWHHLQGVTEAGPPLDGRGGLVGLKAQWLGTRGTAFWWLSVLGVGVQLATGLSLP